ncbi:MAG: GspE/PulE family protein [Candidatus Omnitrophica bacterium]|nr:GspE/PulE family protein [Candidatus Omnitrophota bacterium]MCM8831588.1 GspE/PulE family protein [Candidatus Omnitrophota bacterium]
MTIKEKILSYIQKDKEINKDILKELIETKDYVKFKQLLFENHICTEEDLLLIFSKELRIPFLDLKKYKISAQNKELLPSEIAFRYKVIPLCKIGNVLTIATSNPLDVIVYDDIRIITNALKIELVLCKEEDILKVLEILYKGSAQEFEEFLKELDATDKDAISIEETKTSLEELINESKLPPIVRAIDLMIYNALKKRASDIHIEPQEDRLLVKYRIDGVLQEEFSFPKKNQQAVIARLKIISGLNITESRLPQDGRFKVKFEGREIDFRVSSLPTHFGEKFVLRVLDKESLSIGLANLGFSQEPMQIFSEAIKAPFGIILVTGPTGSGKSTTLYSILNLLNQPDKNIVTIEDPIEYHIEGITQIQVIPEIGLSFAQGLRSVLRQSPDIIMVGEIRDSETADIAIKASLTGELIFSTLHTNNAVGAITRLIDMGIEPFLLASSLVATTAQRLVRKLCPKCKEPYKLDQETIERLNIKNKKGEFFKAVGCPFCNNTGYKGRIAILEILFFDDKMKDMIIQRASEEEIIDYAYKNRGFRPLREDGFLKCSEGITSIEEVLRVTTE